MLITVVEYAHRVGKSANYIRNRCYDGKFKSAEKVNGVWMIDENEAYPPEDSRFRSGKYIGWRKKYGKKPE